MHDTTWAMMRKCALACALVFAAITGMSCARAEESLNAPTINSVDTSADKINAQSGAPTNLQAPSPLREGDDASKSIGDSMSMGFSDSSSSDSLAGFGPSSGTVVGNRALELRDEVLRLRASVKLNENEFALQRSSGTSGSVQYHSTVAAITARLQNGTTRGNPILLRQWDEANGALNEVSSSMGRLNSLQTSVEADASLAAYLLGSIQAGFDLSGAVDEDHDQLKILRDEVSRLTVQLDYLRSQITSDIERQTAYLNSERSNLQTLAFAISRGELLGNNVANRQTFAAAQAPQQSMSPMMAAAPLPPVTSTPLAFTGMNGPQPMSPTDLMRESEAPVAPAAGDVGLSPNIGHLLVLIRYNQPVVDYEPQLSQAVGAALERRPNAQFSVVAVSPITGDPADLAREQQTASQDAEAVKRSLIQLGLAPSRVSIANTQTQNANTPEVHVYIR